MSQLNVIMALKDFVKENHSNDNSIEIAYDFVSDLTGISIDKIIINNYKYCAIKDDETVFVRYSRKDIRKEIDKACRKTA